MKHIALVLLGAAVLAAQDPAIPGGFGIAGGIGGARTPQTQTPRGVYQVGNGVSAPTVLKRVDPAYSEEARTCSVQGAVLLGVVIGADGIPGDFRVTRPLGFGLDEQAILAVRQWRFRPGMRYAEPVPVRANIEVNFRLLEPIRAQQEICNDFSTAVRMLEALGDETTQARGRELMESTAARDFPAAQHRLAMLYEYGDAGSPLDNRRAEEHYRICATAGLARCQAGLGRVLVSDSVKRVEGMAWLELADDGGSAEAHELFTKELQFTAADQQEQARLMKKILLPK